MKPIIIVENTEHLEQLIQKEISINGNKCDLNYLDVSQVTNMNSVFYFSKFNGDISRWNVSSVTNMNSMFNSAEFNQDISNWNVCKVEDMSRMFGGSVFNRDISKWDTSKVTDMSEMFFESVFNVNIPKWNVSSVTNMYAMFYDSKFNHDLTCWKPYNLKFKDDMLKDCEALKPYWYTADNTKRAIELYELHEKLNIILDDINISKTKIKI